MRPQSHSFDAIIADLAARQHGVVALWQLVAVGISTQAVKRRVRAGRLHRVWKGVYAVGHRKISWQGRIMAAVLLHGPAAVASHRTAAALWDLLPPRGNDVYVTVPAAGRAKRKGIVLHQVRGLHEKDRAIRQGIPVTALGRTLIDVFSSESEERTERALEQAERMKLLDGNAIDQACARAPTRRGVKRIRARLRQRRAPAMSRSALERGFLIFCRSSKLPRPEMNAWVEGYEVDVYWRDKKVIVELDDFYTHGTSRAHENDTRRDARLEALDYRVIRITAKRLKAEPGEIADELRRILSGR
jgi:very-short-patch-repair endonuclease